MSKEKNVSITNPSPLYFFEIIEATKKGAKDIDGKSDLKFNWIYEGQDMFSNPDSAVNKLYDGVYVAKELWDLLNAGYKVKGTTKDGVVKEFNTSGEFLAFCFSNNMKVV